MNGGEHYDRHYQPQASDIVTSSLANKVCGQEFGLPIYRRTVADVLAPWQENTDSAAGQFQVEICHEEAVSCPLLSALIQGAPLAVAAKQDVSFIRAFAEPTIRTKLPGNIQHTNGSAEPFLDGIYCEWNNWRQRLQNDSACNERALDDC